MTTPPASPRIVAQPSRPKLSAGQKKFNTLMEKLETRRKLLQQWLVISTTCEKLWVEELVPMLSEQAENEITKLRLLDVAFDQFRLSKKDRATLLEIICVMTMSLMGGEHDEELKQLYLKYTGSDYDEDERLQNQLFKSSLEEELGVELGDDVDLNSIDNVTQHIEEKLREQAEQAQSTQQPKKPTASEIRREQEEAEGSQSLREIYRKLASALHPDREQDADERERKTALMQRVNEAYENDNLLALLQMQMEIEQIEQIDQTHIDNITDKRLKHFNRILSEQLRELEDEIHDRKMLIREQFLMDPYEDIRPKTVNAKCAKQLKAIREHLDDAQDELDALTDPKSLKAWLRDQRDMAEMLERVEEFDDLELLDTLLR
ncbi:DnaJ domain protein [Pseudomonas amygdali pv. eriobotryae]|uniref:DnaJ domain protein n=1 Tax=Pseudomonas amygdali pv. eriobotryae TaxID=129137 RepID=A0A0P9PQM4_PSEA0|nr:J domain-containing protein [Pseudomonas amygdali]KPX22866.1 DnaJ domain protein [Pseudomonas amygdali pv. eriobotryae]KWS77772.1 molecular chaperone DnaJ [Pseudomonas amygdali pv. eriobotryae]RML96826.1 DnaJ domain protein [Pseudomonas amygdali pv. eriobotryae]RMO63238.1 DnaJ domain protein [Pseudomonas amygdali pv. eriobotryae]GFZ73262.1 molecular chaperone DnaJ [Pseudomonas amygdali pv. eriobotryae]